MVQRNDVLRLRGMLQALLSASDWFTVSSAVSFLTVAAHEGRSLRELTDLLHTPQTTLSRHLLDLGPRDRKGREGLGLVDIRPDPHDRRRNFYYLTRKGQALLETLTSRMEILRCPTASCGWMKTQQLEARFRSTRIAGMHAR